MGAYEARQCPELWGIVDVGTRSSDEVRAALSKRVDMVSFPKFCLSSKRHPMFKCEIDTFAPPPFFLERRESQICHSCKFLYGENASLYQRSHAKVVYTCCEYCCFIPVCEDCVNTGVC